MIHLCLYYLEKFTMMESQLPLRFATYLVRHAAKPTRVKPSKPQKRAPETFKPRRSSVADSIKPETLLLDPKDLLAVKPGKSTFTLAEKRTIQEVWLILYLTYDIYRTDRFPRTLAPGRHLH